MRRSDPYMERARELCLAAGVDPDSRVGKGRGQPAWCSYRDAARKEHLAREANAAASEIANLRPQEARFQNAPLKIFGPHEEATVAQMRNCMAVGNVVSGVICADGHLGYGVGRANAERAEHDLFDDGDAWRESDMEAYRQKAVSQLGTVGSGNHYVDLMRDEEGFAWIGVHFGSRGLGHTSATRYLKAAGGKDGMNVPPAVVDEDSEIGRRYIAAMQLAGRYAYAGREWVVERVRQIIGGSVTETVHNHHNYAWRETHDGRDLWVVRKGATPAFPGQKGFVGGSMGDDAVILEGVDSPEAKASLYSTVHGAGRLFGRKEAKRRFSRAEMDRWLNERGVTLIGADLDESPMAYRRLPEVLAQHAGTVKVLHTLRPFAVAMAGDGEFDPWKD